MQIELFVYSKPLWLFAKKNIMTMQVICKNASWRKKVEDGEDNKCVLYNQSLYFWAE